MIVFIASQEVQEERRLREAPFLALAETEDVTEELLGLLAVQEVLLIRRALIGVARSRHDAINAKRHDLIEEPCHALGLGAVEQGAVDGNAEAALLRLTDSGNGTLVDAFLTD